jgi:putative endonuclease
VLYTGITNNLLKRLATHQNGGSSFTSRYKCAFLLYYEEYQSRQMAIAREKEIKGWRRSKKEALINTQNPHWDFLNP